MTIFLVRHGSAGQRLSNDDDPTDLERHLDEVGTAQARSIAAILGGSVRPDVFSDLPAPRITRVLSSPAARCVETVEPLAALLGIEVQPCTTLLEGTELDPAWELLESLALADGDSALCSHGDMIPELIRRARLRGMLVPSKSGCSKGSIWALEWADERFETGTYATTH